MEDQYECMGFMALITAMVVCAKSQRSLLSVSVRRVHVVFSAAGFNGEGEPCPKTGDTPRCREASRKPCALIWDRTQAIGALAHGFTH